MQCVVGLVGQFWWQQFTEFTMIAQSCSTQSLILDAHKTFNQIFSLRDGLQQTGIHKICPPSPINKLGLPNYHNQHSHHPYKHHVQYEKEEHYEALDGNLVVVKRICNSDTDDRRQLCDKGNSETLPPLPDMEPTKSRQGHKTRMAETMFHITYSYL